MSDTTIHGEGLSCLVVKLVRQEIDLNLKLYLLVCLAECELYFPCVCTYVSNPISDIF